MIDGDVDENGNFVETKIKKSLNNLFIYYVYVLHKDVD